SHDQETSDPLQDHVTLFQDRVTHCNLECVTGSCRSEGRVTLVTLISGRFVRPGGSSVRCGPWRTRSRCFAGVARGRCAVACRWLPRWCAASSFRRLPRG